MKIHLVTSVNDMASVLSALLFQNNSEGVLGCF